MDPRKKRVLKEIQKIKSDVNENCTAGPIDDNNIFLWNAKIFGQKGTSFEDGVFDLRISFPDDFPSSPPNVTMLTKMFHPNFNDWIPSLSVSNILISICSLLLNPNPFECLNTLASKMFLYNREQYEQTVKYFTENYAIMY
jgi:ubiquitin-protein ligase